MAKNEQIEYRKIAVAVDGSTESQRAVKHAIHLAANEEAELVIIHVLDGVKQGGVIGLRAKYGDVRLADAFERVATESANRIISPMKEFAEAARVKVRSEVLPDEGKSKALVIVDYARRNKIDMLVVGARGTSKLGKFLAGSITNKLANISECPVVIVP